MRTGLYVPGGGGSVPFVVAEAQVCQDVVSLAGADGGQAALAGLGVPPLMAVEAVARRLETWGWDGMHTHNRQDYVSLRS